MNAMMRYLLHDLLGLPLENEPTPEEPMLANAIRLRHGTAKDIAAMELIENMSQPDPWGWAQFRSELAKDGAGILCAFQGLALAGFALYLKGPMTLSIVRFAVHPELRRRGVARRLFQELKCLRFTVAALMVPEENLRAQLFLRSVGFQSSVIQKDWITWPDGDKSNGLLFEYMPVDVESKCRGK